MEKHLLIVERAPSQLSKINENASSTNKFLLNGIFTEFDIQNRNKRFYTAENFIPCMNQLLEKKKQLGVIYGEYDHPDVFDIAGKNISHAIESLTYNENSNRVDGSIALLSTHWGKEARAVINDGFPLFVSSRAAGVTDANGNVRLKELFTYDIVVDPGFASARVSVNESYGLSSTNDVPYRIYEMKDSDVNALFNNNKNDNKTMNDLKSMEIMIANEVAKLEFQLTNKLNDNKYNPSEVKALVEKIDIYSAELNEVKAYLEFFKVKVSSLIKENIELVKENKQLVYDINENTAYSNHIVDQVKKLQKYTLEIENRLNIDEKMIEYVAEHTKANIAFSDDIAENIEKLQENIKNNIDFTEYIASETQIAQNYANKIAEDSNIALNNLTDFTEYIASETEIAQKYANKIAEDSNIALNNLTDFSEYIASETEIAQNYGEYIANESHKNEIWLNYVYEKVDGIVGYIHENSNNKINENSNNKKSIIDYLGINEEQEIINNIEAQPAQVQTQPVQKTAQVQPQVQPQSQPVQKTAQAQPQQTQKTSQPQQIQSQPQAQIDDTDNEPIESGIEVTLLSALVKLLSSDETGTIIEILPDDQGVVIQKSGSDECITCQPDEYDVIDNNDNVEEHVTSVIEEIKKQKVLANQQPHFFTFLSEEQINDFKSLSNDKKDAIILVMNEAEYYSANDVLNIIGKTIKDTSISYEDKLISNIPTSLKEAWNSLTKDQKISIITESKYYSLITTSDIKAFWNTSSFGKSINSSEATLIKESLSNIDSDNLSDDFVNAFLKKANDYNLK